MISEAAAAVLAANKDCILVGITDGIKEDISGPPCLLARLSGLAFDALTLKNGL